MSRTHAPAAAELRLRAMGTQAHVLVVGGRRGQLQRAQDRIADLEQRWSRFRGDSEVSRLNAQAGHPVAVSDETRLLVRCAVLGWRHTRGLFDPTVYDAVHAAGYDRDLDLVRTRPGRLRPTRPAPGCSGIHIDDSAGTVTLPAGARLDPGGIGKGLAADLVVDELVDGGAAGACVNLGGDLRVAGQAPDGPGWRVEVANPSGGEPVGTLHLRAGAVATSSTLDRRWTVAGVEQHHLIDPATGRPLPLRRAATVVAATAWQAEVAAKAALLVGAGERARLLPGLAAGTLIADGRRLHEWGAIARFLRPEDPAP